MADQVVGLAYQFVVAVTAGLDKGGIAVHDDALGVGGRHQHAFFREIKLVLGYRQIHTHALIPCAVLHQKMAGKPLMLTLDTSQHKFHPP
jgi:hypothetical protein